MLKIPAVSCKYGAPMGRYHSMHPSEDAKVHLVHLRLDSGGYDAGGAYWGLGERIYWASPEGAAENQTFTRARSRELAKAQLLENFPDLRFYR